MLASQIPTKFPIPFGNNAAAGTIRTIPQASQTSTSPGQASLYDGFPVATGQPLASGGVPPAMQDFNGLLNQITAWNRWQNAGGTVTFDQTFCNTIGGYPSGAVLASTSNGTLWLSIADNNTTNPDSGSASNWVALITSASLGSRNIVGSQAYPFYSSGTWTSGPSQTSVRACVWAAGGGAGGAGSTNGNRAGAPGAGGGEYAEGVFAVAPSTAYPVTVGVGGAAGSNAPGNGSNGGLSSFGSFISCIGGAGSTGVLNQVGGSLAAGGSGGVGGTFRQSGSGGGNAIDLTASVLNGLGGPPGFGGSPQGPNVNGSGVSGRFPGGGGTGGSTIVNGQGNSGGPGANGFVLLFA